MGNIGKLLDAANKAVDVIDQTVIDQDKAIEIKAQLAQKMAELMLTGGGASITKWTICILTGVVVLIGAAVFIFAPENIDKYKDYALFTTPLIGLLTGGYAAGTTVQRVMKK